ncbi:SCO family protein [Denitromonas sp.]|uniref:SCO family protein n=1 Tax=Denitromonas sp. TaxID=2734609 RepID=UPI003A8AF891
MLRTLLVVIALALTACSSAEPPKSFKNTDITGADYGKGFSLTDHTGAPRTLADFKGKAVTLFFGFTQCPDVCPTNLLTMTEVMRLLGPNAERTQVLFMTVDPERDTQELLAQYVPAFDERFLGLFGDLATTEAVARDFKVFYRKSGDTEGPNYTIDHSAGTYVFDPQGRLRLYVKHGTSAQDIADDIQTLLAEK